MFLDCLLCGHVFEEGEEYYDFEFIIDNGYICEECIDEFIEKLKKDNKKISEEPDILTEEDIFGKI